MGAIVEPKVRESQALKVRDAIANFWFVEESTRDVKAEFARRLSEVCDDMGVVAGRGRQTALAQQFGISPNAARKWLLGEGLPELEMAIRIANWAQVNVLWLLQGQLPKAGDKIDTSPGELVDAVQGLPHDDGQQVFDFIRYKFERNESWFARETLSHYMTLLDKFQRSKKDKK